MSRDIIWLTFARVGDRVCSKATRVLGTVDRILPNKNLIIITDSGQTVCDHPGHVDVLEKQKVTVRDIKFLRSLGVATLCFVLFVFPACSTQREPDAKRTKEIQAALVTHGFECKPTGKWDNQTRLALHDIAKAHGWQTAHVPDARVLILLELGGPHSDPYVATQTGNHLDGRAASEL